MRDHSYLSFQELNERWAEISLLQEQCAQKRAYVSTLLDELSSQQEQLAQRYRSLTRKQQELMNLTQEIHQKAHHYLMHRG